MGCLSGAEGLPHELVWDSRVHNHSAAVGHHGEDVELRLAPIRIFCGAEEKLRSGDEKLLQPSGVWKVALEASLSARFARFICELCQDREPARPRKKPGPHHLPFYLQTSSHFFRPTPTVLKYGAVFFISY